MGAWLRRLLWLTLILLALVLSLIVNAPGTWWDYALNKASPGSLLLATEQGGLWRGQGRLQALLPDGQVTDVARVDWQVDWSAWYQARLGLDMVDSTTRQKLLAARFSPTGVTVDALHLAVPMSWLGHFSAMVRDAGLNGQLVLNSEQLRIERQAAQWHSSGQAEAIWRGAGTALLSGRRLGDYRLAVSLAGQDLSLTLSTLQGAVNLQGDGQWRIGQRPRLNFVARPAPELARSLEPMLRMLGRDQGDGSYRIVPML